MLESIPFIVAAARNLSVVDFASFASHSKAALVRYVMS